MNCPVCDKAMLVFELDAVEVDHCVVCGGTWLDAGELEILLDGAANRDALIESLHAAAKADEPPRRCPICSKRARKAVVAGSGDRVVVDVCRRGDGVWFDRGELERVVRMGEFAGSGGITSLLGRVFEGRFGDSTG